MTKASVLKVLARCFLGGEPTVGNIFERSSHALGRRWRWLGPLARRYLAAARGETRPTRATVIDFLRHDSGFHEAWTKYSKVIAVRHWLTEPERMQPVTAAANWDIARIESVGELADWLGLTIGELEWFGDIKQLNRRTSQPRLQHYHYRILAKQFGSIRLIEAPKPRLKALQRQILERILDPIPAHPAAHGFVKGRSICTFAAPHAAQHIVLRMDLQDFFPSFSPARIRAFFRTAGYPESVAALLAGICTNRAPSSIWKGAAADLDPRQLAAARKLYSRPHLPQGAPASPALANFCFHRIDCRLAGLAESAGARYTRYADDLACSGGPDFARRAARFSTHVAAILLEDGFSVHHRKTRIMHQGVRQNLAGLVVNRKTNIRRSDYDLLKAILTNCIRHGPETQNRQNHPQFRAHLEGRVAFMESVHPEKGERLRTLFGHIRWP
jgi:RNA-directed DNA polymerase